MSNPVNKTAIADRLITVKELVDRVFSSQADAAKKMEISRQQLNNILNSRVKLTWKMAEKFKAIGINPEWLMSGATPQFLSYNLKSEGSLRTLVGEPLSAYNKKSVELKVYEAPVYANIGSLHSLDDLSYYSIPYTMPNEYYNSNDIAGFEVRGDSMYGMRIGEGDLLIFHKQIKPKDGHIVIVNLNGCIMVKLYKVEDEEGVLYSVPERGKLEKIPKYDDDSGKILGVVFEIKRTNLL